ncbi:MAG: CorA family divalent cation transporter [Candidatus Aenigmatarchaeota archaeon]
MITYFKRTVRGRKMAASDMFSVGSWISAINPSDEEINYLAERFGLNEQNLRSGLDKNEIPRVEFEEEATYIIVKVISKGELLPDTILIAISGDFILTLSGRRPSFVKRIFDRNIKIITTQRRNTLIKFLLMINEDFEKETFETIRIVNAKKGEMKEIGEKELKTLLQQEEKLNALVNSYNYARVVYDKLLKKIEFFEEDQEIMEDLIIESEQGLDLCKSSLRTISNIRNYQTVLLSTKTNRTITILTIVTIFFSVSTAIFGFYGMNVALPFEEAPFVYAYIAFFSILAGLLISAYFLRSSR